MLNNTVSAPMIDQILDLAELSSLNSKSSDGKVIIPIIIKMLETIQTKMVIVLEEMKAVFCTLIKTQNKTV